MSDGHLLVVDDDDLLLETLQIRLELEGYTVTTSSSGDEALRLMGEINPDLVLLDVMMPGRDGFEVCREIRHTSDVPIVLVTARTDTVDVVVGLESGADDYITKPFENHELVARVRSLLRRVRTRPSEDGAIVESLKAGPLEIRADEGVVLKRGEQIQLTKTEFKLLTTLAARANKVFSREQLLNDVWGYDYFGDARLVDVHIRRLRAKIEDDPAAPSIVLTVRGMGYKVTE